MAEKKTYICGECGCVFEGKSVIVNLKERLGKDSFKTLLQNPFKRLSNMTGDRICPECGSENIVEQDEKTTVALPEYMTSGWDSSLLEEYFDPEASSTSVGSPKEKRGIKEFIMKTTDFFNGRINDFKEKYNPSDLMEKIASVAKKAGITTVYHALLLYYALTDGAVPTSKKLIVMAALGYFIAPVDFIPDFILMGLVDDGSVLLFALNQILPYITDEIKGKALVKLYDWFGETDIVSISSGLLPNRLCVESEVFAETAKKQNPGQTVGSELIMETEISEKGENTPNSYNNVKTSNQSSRNMVLITPYNEINDYVTEKFNQPISLTFEGEKEVKVSYTKRAFFKDWSVNIRIGIEEVKADSVLLTYDGPCGLDSIISGAISFITGKFPELVAGIHPEDGHLIRINLSEIEKAKAVVENIELQAINPCEDSLRIEFRLKAAGK